MASNLENLMEMGFSRNKAQRALTRANNDIEQATNFLVEPDDEDDIEVPDLLPAANVLESSQHPPSIRARDSFHSGAAMGIPVIPNAPLIYANPSVPFPVIPTNAPLIYANPSVPTAGQIYPAGSGAGGEEGDGDADQDLLEAAKAASLLSLDTPQPAMDDKDDGQLAETMAASLRSAQTDSDTRSLMERLPSSGLPEHWQANDADKHVQLFDVAKSSAEYKEVHDICGPAFVRRYEISRLQRIQNPALWAGYRVQREHTKEPNEIWAVHGSVLDSLDNISANGFNRSYNGKNATLYGKGTYFAKTGNFTYSCSPLYAAPNTDGTQSIILAKVVEGKSTLGTPDMVVPPYIDAATRLRYDSTTDPNGTILVTYHDYQAYPAYFITFKPMGQPLQQQAATALTSNAIAALHQPNLQHLQQQLSAAQAIFQLQQQAATRAANGSVLTSKANAALQGGFPSCNTPGCTRKTWNGQHGEQCCRTCMATNGASHGLDCQAKEACEMLQACTHDEPGAPPRSLPPARSPAPHPANPPPAFPTGGPAFPTGGNPEILTARRKHTPLALLPRSKRSKACVPADQLILLLLQALALPRWELVDVVPRGRGRHKASNPQREPLRARWQQQERNPLQIPHLQHLRPRDSPPPPLLARGKH